MNDYDNIVSFGHVLAKTIFLGDEDPVESLLAYFEKPHKYEREYRKWIELGGTLDQDCLNRFADWHEAEQLEALNV